MRSYLYTRRTEDETNARGDYFWDTVEIWDYPMDSAIVMTDRTWFDKDDQYIRCEVLDHTEELGVPALRKQLTELGYDLVRETRQHEY